MIRHASLHTHAGLLVLFAALACAPFSSNALLTRLTEKEHPPHAHHKQEASTPSGHSLHQLQAQWTDQNGQTRQLADFAGRVVVLAMVYTSCEHACPRIIADMRRIRAAFPQRSDQIEFVLASIDPRRDSVTHLAKFGGDTGLTAQGWTLMRADDTSVRELAAVLGVQYRPTSPTDFAHSNIISIIGGDGELKHQQMGLGSSPNATIQSIRQLLAQP